MRVTDRGCVVRVFGLLTATIALTILNGWFVVYGLIVVTASPVSNNPIAAVIRETPSYLILAALLLAGLVSTVIELVKLGRKAGL
ncbi:hypothetical protein [Burkholderia catarinensis]|uniref:hypothetical protein n=1 Tax=Burkholderia catarinensis TaxID=1108140 RepID=UPI00091CEAB1|nr:hypothetical protein [Burkholderia catarinensis]KAG8149056.1 hypothetical protein BFF94_034590 [Burkholderia catarinensis]